MHALQWETEVDTPATVAVIGGGPVGIEAALYARFLGYFVLLFDSAKVGDRQLAWRDHPLAASWSAVTSSLGLAALRAQDATREIPAERDPVSCREYVERYLLPLARTDLLYDSVHVHSKVVSVSRIGAHPTRPMGLEQRAEQEFRLLIQSQQRGEYSQLVDIVLDCSGQARGGGLATGGGLASGQTTYAAELLAGKVDVEKVRAQLAGKHTLIYGDDACSCGNAVDVSRLIADDATTRLTWVRPKYIAGAEGSSVEFPAGLPDELAQQVHELLRSENPQIALLSAWGIESLQRHDGEWAVKLQSGLDETLGLRCDTVINCAAATGTPQFCSALHADQMESGKPLTSEPHYYLLGQRAVGSQEPCSIASGLGHIRECFGLIGGRGDLDLYDIVRRQQEQ